jgi:oligopeptide/dipeptide ABC transporter ATP-binding protein
VSMLEVKKVSKVYKTGTFGGGYKLALRGVDFAIDRGEVVSLIGQSGSGKSTLGKIILRLAPLSAGAVDYEGSDISSLGKRQLRNYYRHVQGVFQDPFSSYNPVYKADRVFEMVRSVYFPEVNDQAWHHKIGSALESVALNPADVLNKFPHQLSGGQQQRLLIARALLLDVNLLVADEIISMLDASTRVDVLNLLVDLKKRGLGILFITHDLSLGNYISDRTVILRRGAIVEMGDTGKVFGNPQHPYTKSLLTAVPQLHRRWAPLAIAGNATVAVTNGHNATGSRRAGKADDANHKDLPAAQHQGPRPSLMEMPPEAWGGRRFRTRSPGLAEVLAGSTPPPLRELEPGHFAAVEES